MRKQTAESFWARVRRGDGCWEWQGSCVGGGYGRVRWHGQSYFVHRIVAWLEGMVSSLAAPEDSREPTHVLHRCDNRKCCRPDHLFLGSYSDNQLDAYQKGRRVPPRGEHRVGAKLTNMQAAQIRSRHAAGELQVSLAQEHGVSATVIRNVVKGRNYK